MAQLYGNQTVCSTSELPQNDKTVRAPEPTDFYNTPEVDSAPFAPETLPGRDPEVLYNALPPEAVDVNSTVEQPQAPALKKVASSHRKTYTSTPLPCKRFYGLRPTTLFLSIAFASALVLAVVAAGVAGLLAAKRDTGARCVTQPTVSSLPQVVSNDSCSSFNTSSLHDPNAIVNPFHVNDSPFAPSSNCTALGDVYSSFVTQTQFRPLCAINLFGDDLYSVFVYYCTDCIEACATWNNFPALSKTCYGVAYDYNYSHPRGLYGNCWLKNSSNIAASEDSTVFSASLIQR